MISILVVYCCVTSTQFYYLTQTFYYSLTPKCFSGLEFQEGLSADDSCWGGGSIYHEVQTRYQLQSSGGLTEAGKVWFWCSSGGLGSLLAVGRSFPHHMDHSRRTSWAFWQYGQLASPEWVVQERKSKEEVQGLLWLMQKSDSIISTSSIKFSSYSKREWQKRKELHLIHRDISRNLWTYFKATKFHLLEK